MIDYVVSSILITEQLMLIWLQLLSPYIYEMKILCFHHYKFLANKTLGQSQQITHYWLVQLNSTQLSRGVPPTMIWHSGNKKSSDSFLIYLCQGWGFKSFNIERGIPRLSSVLRQSTFFKISSFICADP